MIYSHNNRRLKATLATLTRYCFAPDESKRPPIADVKRAYAWATEIMGKWSEDSDCDIEGRPAWPDYLADMNLLMDLTEAQYDGKSIPSPHPDDIARLKKLYL